MNHVNQSFRCTIIDVVSFLTNRRLSQNAEWKLMLMNNHDSHLNVTSEFITLANDNHIRPFSLIPHLTHCTQSLDVGIFQPYKKWHDTSIKQVIAESFVEYSLTRFLSDLTKIRNNIFKSIIIRHASEKCDMWPVNADICIKLLNKFNYSVQAKVKEPTLHLLRQSNQLDEVAKMGQAWKHWGLKIARNTQWSDPADETQFSAFTNNSEAVIFNTLVENPELNMWRQRSLTELHDKKYARKRLRGESGNLGLTREDAERAIAAKLQKEKEMRTEKELTPSS